MTDCIQEDINLFFADLLKLSDRQIQNKYLNPLAYTDLVTSALSQLKDDRQVLRILRLALEVDFFLGATLARAIKTQLQAQVIDWIIDLKISEKVKIEILKTTQSELAVPFCKNRLLVYLDRDQDDF